MKKVMALLLALAMILTLVNILPAVAADDITVRTFLIDPSPSSMGWIETNSGNGFATVFSTTRAMKAMVLPLTWAKPVDIKVTYTLYRFTDNFLNTVNDDSNILYTASFITNGDHPQPWNLDFGGTYPAGEYMVTFKSQKVSEDGHFVLPVMQYGNYDTAFPAASYFENYKYGLAGIVQEYTRSEPLCYSIVFDGNDTSSTDFFKPISGREGLISLDDSIVGWPGAATAADPQTPYAFYDTGILTPEIPEGKVLYSFTFGAAPTWDDNSGNINVQYDVYVWEGDYDTTVDAEPLYTNTVKYRINGRNLELELGNTCVPGSRYLIRVRSYHFDPATGNQSEGQICGGWYNPDGGTNFNAQGFKVYQNGTEFANWAARSYFRYANLNTESVIKYSASELQWIANCGTFTAEGDKVVARSDGATFAMWCEAKMPKMVFAQDYKYFAVKAEFRTSNHIGFYAKVPGVNNYKFANDQFSVPVGEQIIYTTFDGTDPYNYENYYRTVVLPLFGEANHNETVAFEEIAFLKTDADLYEYLGQGIISAGITLGEDITFNVSAEIFDPAVTSVKMNFLSGEDEVTVDGTLGSDGKYHFAYEGLTPQRMSDEILMELVLDGTVYQTKTSSVDLYAQGYYDIYGDGGAATALLALQYGTAAQEFMNYNIGNPAAHEDWSTANYLGELDKPAFVKTRTGSTDAASTISAASILLDNGFKLKFKYSCDASTDFVLADGNGNAVPFEVTTSGSSKIATAKASVMPMTFRAPYEAKLVSGGSTIVTVTYSLTAYINAKWDDANAGQLVQALYAYLTAAEAYILLR